MMELERRNRIRCAVAAYAYEILHDSLMSDSDWDKLAKSIDVDKSTGNEALDAWYKKEFSPHTGQWVHKHPEQDKLYHLAVWWRRELCSNELDL